MKVGKETPEDMLFERTFKDRKDFRQSGGAEWEGHSRCKQRHRIT